MDVFRSALSLVIHKNGKVNERDVDDLLERYRVKKGIAIDKTVYIQAVRSATNHYNRHERCLLICTDSRCLNKAFVNPSGASIKAIADELGCAVEATGCHWQCDDAPVLTLKSGSNQHIFPGCNSSESWCQVRTAILCLLNSQRRVSK